MKRVRVGVLCFAMLVASLAGLESAQAEASQVNLRHMTIVHPPNAPVLQKAAEMLRDEVARRSALEPQVLSEAPQDGGRAPGSVVVLLHPVDVPDRGEQLASLRDTAGMPADLELPETPEGFALWYQAEARAIHLAGRDARGALFAAGRLLQLLEFKDGVRLAADTRVASAPRYPYRAHQLGYRNTANSYDAWDVPTFEQYIRDLVIFGTNGIELIPGLEPGQMDGPVMDMDMWEMTLALCDLLGSYGIDVWMWIAVEEDLTLPGEAEAALARRRALFEACSTIDHIFVPGGDDGDNPAEVLIPWMEELAVALQETHPNATLWVSNQTWTDEENDYFYNYLEEEDPAWLTGVVYGPWIKSSMQEMRDRTPERFKLRRYPDINHNVRCQYPVPLWDPAFAHTLGREPVMPRQHEMAHIHNLFDHIADGFGTYSDGIHDDLNKFVWSALGWDPETSVERIVADHARIFFAPDQAERVAEGLAMLERNWHGPILENDGIAPTLRHWQAIWESRDTEAEPNWRLQMYLFRAYYDAYVQEMARRDRDTEALALEVLAETSEPAAAIAAARAVFGDAEVPEQAQAYRDRIETLALELLDSIGFQLSIKPPYLARNAERGAVLDYLDQPLNNRLWMDEEFARILTLDAGDQRAALDGIVHWENPGPGGFYDDLGNLTKQPHLVAQHSWEEDPGFVRSPQAEFDKAMHSDTLEFSTRRLSWHNQAQTLYGTPLLMRYEGLDPEQDYTLRVTYAGRFNATMRLVANGTHEIHGPLPQPQPVSPVEFAVPRAATASGTLELAWELIDGRGCQVAEVWLLPANAAEGP